MARTKILLTLLLWVSCVVPGFTQISPAPGVAVKDEGTLKGRSAVVDCIGTGIVCDVAGGVITVTGNGVGTGLAEPAGDGIVVRSGSGNTVNRTLTGTANNITITNGDGVAGNPTFDLGSTAVQTDQTNVFGAFLQDLNAATLKLPIAAGAAPATTGLIQIDSTSNTAEIGINGVNKTFAMTDSNITGNAATATTLTDGDKGDVTVTGGALAVEDDSHAHTSSTVSGLDISADTNLAVTAPVVLTGDTLSLSGAATLDAELDSFAELVTFVGITGTCDSTTFVRGDGTCDAPAAIGDITDVWGASSGNVNALTAAAGDSLDAGSADASSPATRSASLPGTCTEGQMHQNTGSGGTETYICTAANTWTKIIGLADLTDANIPDTITASNYLLLSGGTLTGDLNIDNQSDVRLFEADGNGSNFIALQAPASVASNLTLTLAVSGDCTGNTNGGALTIDGSNQIVCSDDDGGGGGGTGDAAEIEDGDNANTFTAIDTTARLDDSGDINFAFTDGGAGGPDIVTTTVRADSVALTTDTTGSYAAGDAEAGNALAGDTATAFFSAGQIENARGGTGDDTSATTGMPRIDSGNWTYAELSGDVVTTGSNATVIQANSVALTTDTTGNYVLSITNGTGISGGNGGSEGAALTLSATLGIDVDTTELVDATIAQVDVNDTATLAADPAFGASSVWFATTGLIFEGATSNANEGLLIAADVSADVTWTLPNETGTICTTGSVCTGYQAGPLTGDVVTSGGAATIQANSVALTTDTSGNYVTSVATTSPLTGGAAGSEGGVLTIAIAANGIGPTQIDETADYTFTTLSGKIDRNNTVVSDDDCTGEQGLSWYDTTDSAHEFCDLNSGTPITLAGAGDMSAIGDCTSGAAFTGGCGTTLQSNTDLILELDNDNNGTESFQIKDGADNIVFEVTEDGQVSGGSSTTPTFALQDANNTDREDNVRFLANCTVTTTGAEDCDATIDQYVDGVVKNVITSVADGAGTIGSDQSTSWTIITAGTGNAAFVVPAQSIGGAEMLNDGVSATQLDSAGVESELEGVLDLTDLQGTLTVAKGGTGLTAGTSGGIPYYSSTSAITSSAALTLDSIVLGGGAGAAPKVDAGLVFNATDDIVTAAGGFSSDTVKVVEGLSGANLGAKIATGLTALASTGGVLDARSMTGAQDITADLTWSQANITLLLPCNSTITGSAGVQFTITGASAKMIGCGQGSTVLDFTAGTSAVSHILMSGPTADDAVFQDFTILGNRTAGGTANQIEVFASSGLIDRLLIQRVTFTNAGNHAFLGEKFGGWLLDNKVNTPKASGLRGRSGGQELWVQRNIVRGDLSGTAGDGGIAMTCSGTLPCSNHIYVTHNQVYNAGIVGIRLGAADPPNYPGYIEVSHNIIDTVGGTGMSDGECIAFSAQYAKVAFNTVRNCWSYGIQSFGSNHDIAFIGNIITNVSLHPSANAHGAIGVTAGTGSLVYDVARVLVALNQVYDDQGTPTTPYLISVDDFSTAGTGTHADITIIGNVGSNILNTPRSRCVSTNGTPACTGDPEIAFSPYLATATGAETSARLLALLSDESGTGPAIFGTSPTIATPNLTGKIDFNNVAVDDDDCTGEQGKGWYDSTDVAWEFCNANSGAPTVLGGGAGAPTDADYLVGTANGSLSAEIVVGTTPGGELGNTWASPTIDDGITVANWTLTTPVINTATIGTSLLPTTNDGAALGASGTAFSDIFLATGAVIDFGAGNEVLTHSSGILTVSTGDLRVTTAGTNAASAVTVGGTQTLTNKTLTTPTITSLANTLTKSAWVPVDVTDGTQCAAPAMVTIGTGPKVWTVICTDNDASTIFGSVKMPTSWNGGTVQFTHTYIQTAADTAVLNGDIACQARSNGEALSSTWGTEIAIDDAAVTGSNQNDMTTSGAVTCSGTTPAGGDMLYFRYQLDAAGTTTAVATLHHIGFMILYGTTSLTD